MTTTFSKSLSKSLIENSITECRKHFRDLKTLVNIYDVHHQSSHPSIEFFLRGFYLGKYGEDKYKEDISFPVIQERCFYVNFPLVNCADLVQVYRLSGRYARVSAGYYRWLPEVATSLPDTSWEIVFDLNDSEPQIYLGSRSVESLVTDYKSVIDNY